MAEQVLHKGLTPERWNRFPIRQRLQMIDSEFQRAMNLLKESEDRFSAKDCILRADELIRWTLTASASGWEKDDPLPTLKDAVRVIATLDFDGANPQGLLGNIERIHRQFSELWSHS